MLGGVGTVWKTAPAAGGAGQPRKAPPEEGLLLTTPSAGPVEVLERGGWHAFAVAGHVPTTPPPLAMF